MKISRWLKRISKWSLALLVVLISLYALAYAWISWSAKREWAQTKKELEGRGEKLSLADFIPPLIPDEDNMFNAPLFHGLRNEKGKSKYRVEELAGAEMTLAARSSGSQAIPNLAKFSQHWRKSENKNQSDAEIALKVFGEHPIFWEELFQATKKTQARFPVRYEQTYVALLPHIPEITLLCRLLYLRALAFMETGKPANAEQDILRIFQLSDTLEKEPLLISQFVRMSDVSLAFSGIYEGIQRHVWTPQQLKSFEDRLAYEKFIESGLLALRGERGTINECLMQLLSNKWEAGKFLSNIEAVQNDGSQDEYTQWWSIIIPWDWAYYSMAFCSLQIQRTIDVFMHAGERGINRQNSPFPSINLNRVGYFKKIKYLFVGIFLPAIEDASKKFVKTQTQNDLARIACVLERYWIANGVYPEKLETLVPQYIQKLPQDVAIAAPYHYRLNARDNFTLWSVGFDGVDDGGVPITKANLEKGDRVWGAFETK
ncbi:MAG: hypothetical protein ABIP97_06195 [Chthoniobacterales bacterium]